MATIAQPAGAFMTEAAAARQRYTPEHLGPADVLTFFGILTVLAYGGHQAMRRAGTTGHYSGDSLYKTCNMHAFPGRSLQRLWSGFIFIYTIILNIVTMVRDGEGYYHGRGMPYCLYNYLIIVLNKNYIYYSKYNQTADKDWTYSHTHHSPSAGATPFPSSSKNGNGFISNISKIITNSSILNPDGHNVHGGAFDDNNFGKFGGPGKTVHPGDEFYRMLINPEHG